MAAFTPALIVIVAVSALVRSCGARGDLWLDEIWSLGLAFSLKSPIQIFQAAEDNNHPLNTLYLYCIGTDHAQWQYRLFSVISGTATVALSALLARTQYRALSPAAGSAAANRAGLLGGAIMGGSYLLIHYSSEARGYAPALCFGLLALFALWREPARRWSAWIPVYWMAAILAFLAHAEAAAIVGAGTVWSGVALYGRTSRWGERLAGLARWHAVPLLALGIYYCKFLAKLAIGGGPKTPVLEVSGLASAYALGLPPAAGVVMGLPILTGAVFVGVWRLWRNQARADAAFYISVIATALGPVIFRPHTMELFPRYFLVNVMLALLLASGLVAIIWNRSRTGRRIAIGGLVAFYFGNALHVARLIHYGRGEYQAAVQYLARHTPTAVISVGSDHDFRNFAVLSYYARALGADRAFNYYPAGRADLNGPQWLFLHRVDGKPPPNVTQPAPLGPQYQFEHLFHHAALSGWDWYLYRNVNLVPE